MRWLLFATAAVLLPALLAGRSPAEDDDADAGGPFPFMVRDTNAARFAVREAERLMKEGEFDAAVEPLQRLLDQHGDDWYRTESREESTRWRTATETARDLLAALPPEGRAAYERRVRPAAAPLLARAVARRDRPRLEEVLLRFGASEAGIAAGRLIAEDAFAQGRFPDAAWAARETLRFAPSDAPLWTMLVDALAATGDGDALAALAPPRGLSAAARGESGPLEARLARARRANPQDVPPRGWPMWGGTAARDARTTGDPPFPTPRRWARPLAVQRRAQDDEPRYLREDDIPYRFEALWATYRPVHPATADRIVYLADGLSIRALDGFAGRSVWSFDANAPSPLPLLRRSYLHGRTSLERAFAPVLTDDLVLATVEVDRPYEPEMLQTVEISSYQPRRVLVAVSRQDGRFRWAMGRSEEDRPLLEGLSVVSPPVVSEGLALVLLSAHRGVHNLFAAAFDVASGRLVWRRTIGSGQQELNLFGNPVKELAAGAPAVAGGVMYAWTGLGYVVALETRTGRPRWLASYRIQPIEPVQYWFRAPLRLPRIAPTRTIVHGDVVVAAPSDGEHLHAFDRLTGRLLWRHELKRDEFRPSAVWHLLGLARDGRRDLVVVAGSEVRALDLTTGTLAWRGRYDDDSTFAVGEGLIADDQVLVPTATGLQRFSVRSQGKLLAADPWPQGAEPGNLLVAGQILLVASRGALQAFYSWEEIRRDLDRRRRERPEDPTVLLEAAEVYRLGGELAAARRAYEEALRLAKDAASEPARRAREGLHATWLAAGDASLESSPAQALKAYRSALPWADDAEQRIAARLKIDATLRKDPTARIRNLEDLVTEAESAVAVFDEEEGPVPARAAALLRLAEVQVAAARPAEAVNALQRLLREEGDAPFPEGPARRRARAAIDELLAAFGPGAYREQEEQARALLARAQGAAGPSTQGTVDGVILDRLLREYPNAAVVPEALLRLGRYLADGDPRAATDALRRLLREHPTDPRVPEAVALLTRASAALGERGASRAALARLTTRFADASFALGERTWTGRAFAEAEGGARPLALERPALSPPLREAAFEAAGDDESFPKAIPLAVDPDEPSPLALLGNGTLLVGIDLPGARVAFRAATGTVQRAAYAEGMLVVAVPRALKGHSPLDGTVVWEVALDGFASYLETSRGIVYALVKASGPGGVRHLLAVDPTKGRVLWTEDLGTAEVGRALVADGDVLLERVRGDGGPSRAVLEVYDGLAGGKRREIDLPAGRVDREQIVAGPDLLLLGREPTGERHIAAVSVATGRARWRRDLGRGTAPCALVPAGDRVWLLHQDGRVIALSLATGEVVHETRVFAGEGVHACPFPGTDVVLDGGRLVFVPWVSGRDPAPRALAYDLKTGKLAWESRFPPGRQPSKVSLLASGGVAAFVLVHQTNVRGMTVRLLDLDSGRTLQEIDPSAMAEDLVPTVVEGFGTLLIYGRSGVAIYAGSPRDEAPEAPSPR